MYDCLQIVNVGTDQTIQYFYNILFYIINYNLQTINYVLIKQ